LVEHPRFKCQWNKGSDGRYKSGQEHVRGSV
jgi:hypothetical protein